MSDNNELNKLLSNSQKKSDVRVKAGRYPYEPEVDIKEGESFTRELVQWTTSDNKIFIPSAQTTGRLTPGVYEIKHSPAIGLYFQKIPVKTEGIIKFPETNSSRVVEEIQKFWEKEHLFRANNLTYQRGIILWGPAGCHAPGTKILMFDGTTKLVENIEVGDLLAGPDSKSRKVLELKTGKDKMYRISTNWHKIVVNENHILSLKNDKIENISLLEYLRLPEDVKPKYKLWKPNSELVEIKQVEFLEEGTYHGFSLSDDHLYLTNDLIVHHNSGKTCTIQLIMQDVIDRGGIVVKFDNPTLFIEGMRSLREIEKETPVVVIMEDIDSILDTYNESSVLNVLDGVDKIEKIVYLATTNYPDRLGARIINRPSRFDKRFKIGFPNAESRAIYLKHLLKDKVKDVDLDKWVEDTDKFTTAHLKELFVAVLILGDNYEEAIDTLRSMKEEISYNDMEDKENMNIFSKKRRTEGSSYPKYS